MGTEVDATCRSDAVLAEHGTQGHADGAALLLCGVGCVCMCLNMCACT